MVSCSFLVYNDGGQFMCTTQLRFSITASKVCPFVLDGDVNTAWHQDRSLELPVDLIIDLGEMQELNGFRYHPDMGLWGPGIITHFEFFVSTDNKNCKKVSSGEFSNIKNNPLWQVKEFNSEKARFIKFRALANTEGNNNIGYAEIEVITN